MESSLSYLVDNLTKGNHKIKCKYGHDNKTCETCGFKYKDCECSLENKNVKDNLIEYKCLCCNNNYRKRFDENIKKKFANTYKFSNREINKFKTLLLGKKELYNHLNTEDIEDITDADYTYRKVLKWILKGKI